MLADGADPEEEWNVWKLIPSTITEEEIAELTDKFEGLDHAYNPHLIANNFLPFTWDKENYLI
ncbi:MAG: hypothetical protein IJF07_07525 [Lachnospiraceae bacterium]|nr:hypothetical protein [Lachnospiraceae bacterium]